MYRRIDLLVAACAATLAVACGGDDKEANTAPQPVQCPPGQFFDGQFCQMASPTPQPPAQQPGVQQQQPTVGPTTPAISPVPVATATPGPNATPIDATMAAAATPIIQQLAAQQLPAGAKPLGAPFAGQFQQGQSLEQQIQMQPGKCYTVVAAGVPPIANVDLQIVPITPLPGLMPVLAQDSDTGATAVIGAQKNCYKWAFPAPAPMKIIMTVSSGQGVAAAQVYEK